MRENLEHGISGNASLDAEKIKSELFPRSEIVFSVFLATLRLEGRDLGGGVIPLTHHGFARLRGVCGHGVVQSNLPNTHNNTRSNNGG